MKAMVLSSMVFSVATAAALAQESGLKKGEEVEVTSGAVTGLACALEARDKGNLNALTSCPLAEAVKDLVVFDVAEKQIYRVAPKKIRKFEMEKAYGGGSVDFTAKVTTVNKKDGIPTVEVSEYTVNPKPKAGGFKGCL